MCSSDLYCRRLLEACGEAMPIFCLGDDFATQRGMMISPADWRRLLRPLYARLFAPAKAAGKIVWFPEHIKGGARAKVLEGLFKRALITPDGDDWVVAAEGYDALCLPRPGALPPTITLDDPELEADVTKAEASWQTPSQDRKSTRLNSSH